MRQVGRATQGVKLIDLRGKDYIASITKVPTENEEDAAEEGAAGEENIIADSNNDASVDTNNEKE